MAINLTETSALDKKLRLVMKECDYEQRKRFGLLADGTIRMYDNPLKCLTSNQSKNELKFVTCF